MEGHLATRGGKRPDVYDLEDGSRGVRVTEGGSSRPSCWQDAVLTSALHDIQRKPNQAQQQSSGGRGQGWSRGREQTESFWGHGQSYTTAAHVCQYSLPCM